MVSGSLAFSRPCLLMIALRLVSCGSCLLAILLKLVSCSSRLLVIPLRLVSCSSCLLAISLLGNERKHLVSNTDCGLWLSFLTWNSVANECLLLTAVYCKKNCTFTCFVLFYSVCLELGYLQQLFQLSIVNLTSTS